MLKLKDIAERTNVSVSTVSRILSNKGNFSEETKQKVLEVAKEYLYTPGITLQKINEMSYTVGIFVTNSNDFLDDDPSSSIELNNLKDELEAMGHKIILTTNTGKLDKNSTCYKLLQERAIDGAVVFDPFVSDEIMDELNRLDIPYIVTNGRDYNKPWNYIDYDNYGGTYKVIEYLYELGHRDIAILAGPSDHWVNQNRMEGCRAAIRDFGLSIDENHVIFGSFSMAHGHQAVEQLISYGTKFTAICALADTIALGANKALRSKGLRVPEDVSIVGFDDWKVSEYMSPPLTSVRRFKYDINQLIASMMSQIISNKYISQFNITLKTELIIRESCKNINEGSMRRG
ncbi:LacI family DNA-binding transcriptional regulator [Paenibacillus mendelii]|uniref:LacI family DNA-binding transcriptional regulator n=1 Tax=Paenibacillus mendelii TaxID=206163 RepID=A0ABV6JHT0_9BACL|nr:LacI family DNA-binding transcriptional regulator [Paenibacillus mendelii]MCQ6563459.1 LacI family transcriptional regulator [Paenibacillus mendelii]